MASPRESAIAPAQLTKVDAYEEWQRSQGVPIVGGFYVEDLTTLELGPWPQKGGRGAFLNLEGTGGVDDAQVVEIALGKASEPERHLFEAMVYVLRGRGATTVWYDGMPKQTFEWTAGSLFSIPLNAWYQHFNGSGSEPARYIAVTNAPTIIRLFHNADFVFDNYFAFRDRFGGEEGFFSGQGNMLADVRRRVWEANFIPDLLSLDLHPRAERGGGGSILTVEMADSSMGAHVSQFRPAMYKKAHRHGPGAHVIILNGSGYSMLWHEGDQERHKCDWKPGSVVVPPADWFHQHFNTGTGPARYLALRYSSFKHRQAHNVARGDGSDVSVKQGGWQIEYHDEDRQVHELFERELALHGGTCHMKSLIPWCTGEAGELPRSESTED